MTQRPLTEDQAKDLFARQINAPRRRGAAPASTARLAAVFARHEAACREQEGRLVDDEPAQSAPNPPAPEAMDVTATALDEIEAVLDGALDYGGAEHAREVRDRFKRLFDVLDRGICLGSPAPNSGCRTTSASSRPNPTPS